MVVFIQIQQLKNRLGKIIIHQAQMHLTLVAFVVDGPDTVL
jgi:hypothetical protein